MANFLHPLLPTGGGFFVPLVLAGFLDDLLLNYPLAETADKASIGFARLFFDNHHWFINSSLVASAFNFASARAAGLEPATGGFGDRCSTN